jgi:hypothetical protein
VRTEAKLLRDLELPPATSSGIFFPNFGSTLSFAVVLQDKEVCSKILTPLKEPIAPKNLSLVLHVQLDNYWKNNKSRYMFCFWSMLVGIFEEVFVSFLLVGYTHEDIDTSFGRWNMKLREDNHPTIPLLMHFFMELNPNSYKVILSPIKEVPTLRHLLTPKGPR